MRFQDGDTYSVILFTMAVGLDDDEKDSSHVNKLVEKKAITKISVKPTKPSRIVVDES